MADYPKQLTAGLAEVLGMPNFQLHPIWMALREVGVEIKPRYEDEAAAALHFLIPFALEHDTEWRAAVRDRLVAMKAEHEAGTG